MAYKLPDEIEGAKKEEDVEYPQRTNVNNRKGDIDE